MCKNILLYSDSVCVQCIFTGVEHAVEWRMEMGMIPRFSCDLGNEVEMKHQLYIAADCIE